MYVNISPFQKKSSGKMNFFRKKIVLFPEIIKKKGPFCNSP
jgi:hypothetical protein